MRIKLLQTCRHHFWTNFFNFWYIWCNNLPEQTIKACVGFHFAVLPKRVCASCSNLSQAFQPSFKILMFYFDFMADLFHFRVATSVSFLSWKWSNRLRRFRGSVRQSSKCYLSNPFQSHRLPQFSFDLWLPDSWLFRRLVFASRVSHHSNHFPEWCKNANIRLFLSTFNTRNSRKFYRRLSDYWYANRRCCSFIFPIAPSFIPSSTFGLFSVSSTDLSYINLCEWHSQLHLLHFCWQYRRKSRVCYTCEKGEIVATRKYMLSESQLSRYIDISINGCKQKISKEIFG